MPRAMRPGSDFLQEISRTSFKNHPHSSATVGRGRSIRIRIRIRNERPRRSAACNDPSRSAQVEAGETVRSCSRRSRSCSPVRRACLRKIGPPHCAPGQR